MWSRLGEYKFRLLLAALLLMILTFPALADTPSGRAAFEALLLLVVLAGILTVFQTRRLRLAALSASVPTVLLPWLGQAWGPDRPPTIAVATHCAAALFFGCVVAATVSAVYREESISADGICGTLCGYLLLGVSFGHVYCALEAAAPGAFLLNGARLPQLEHGGWTHFLLIYFSLITLTTVGYGDILPLSMPARSFAAVQAVLGQFYLAVLLADLVGKRVAQMTARPPSSAGPGEDSMALPTGRTTEEQTR
jgi:hypothetical protein